MGKSVKKKENVKPRFLFHTFTQCVGGLLYKMMLFPHCQFVTLASDVGILVMPAGRRDEIRGRSWHAPAPRARLYIVQEMRNQIKEDKKT